jgi:hypothetical protein
MTEDELAALGAAESAPAEETPSAASEAPARKAGE